MKLTLSIAMLLLAFLTADIAFASKLYRYQDENGRWHFTDQEPMVEAEVEMTQLEVFEPKKMLSVTNQGTRRQPKLYAVNHSYGPLMVELTITGDNIKVEPSTHIRKVIPANQTVLLATVGPENLQYSFRYRYSSNYTLGDPSAEPDESVSYQLSSSTGSW